MSSDKPFTEEESRIKVGDLRRQLEGYPDDTEITFGCTLDATPLIFYRVKTRGKNLVQIELNELTDELAGKRSKKGRQK